MLIKDLQEPLLSAADKKDQMNNVFKYFLTTRGRHCSYSFGFFFLELLNFVNCIGQIFFVDLFLDGEFFNFGWQVLTLTGKEHEDRSDPMAVVFPKVTKCTFHQFGRSGTIENWDGLCVLALNVINEKIFIFLFIWLLLVSKDILYAKV